MNEQELREYRDHNMRQNQRAALFFTFMGASLLTAFLSSAFGAEASIPILTAVGAGISWFATRPA